MENETYKKEMFEAYIATPSRYEWYTQAFEALQKDGGRYVWYWNSWGFIGGVWYLLYRKVMSLALIALFALIIMGAVLPLGGFVVGYLGVALLIGGYGTGEVYHSYAKHHHDITAMFKGEQGKSIGVMRIIGGVNTVALYAGLFTFVAFVLIAIGLLGVSTPMGAEIKSGI